MYAVFNAENYYKRDVDEWMALIAKIDPSAHLSLSTSGDKSIYMYTAYENVTLLKPNIRLFSGLFLIMDMVRDHSLPGKPWEEEA